MERYGNAIRKTFQASVRMAFSNSLFATVMMFLGFGSIAAIMWYGGREVIAGRLTLTMINGFLMYSIMIAGSMAGLASIYGQFRAAIGGVRRVFEILDLRPSVEDAPHATVLPAAQGRIRFENVTFHYEQSVPVIRGITLDIPAGEILALVGPSGAGKSTLFNLIPRFYDPAGGSIQIDGHDLRSVTQESFARPNGHRAARDYAVRGHDPREHPLRTLGRDRGRDDRGRRSRQRPLLRHRVSPAIRNGGRRARHPAERRTAPEDRGGARHSEGSAHSAAGRSYQFAR